MPNGKLISPNQLQEAAIAMMLGGAPPTTDREWILCVNFWAANIQAGLEKDVCRLMKMLFDCPLPDEVVEEIARLQSVNRRRPNPKGTEQ